MRTPSKTRHKPRRRTKRPNYRKDLEALQKTLVIRFYGRDCFTCDATNLEGKNCQLGHVPWPRTDLSTACKYDPKYARIQCFVCNIHRGGRAAVATLRMQREGVDLDEMWAYNLSTKNKTYGTRWFREQIAWYQSML